LIRPSLAIALLALTTGLASAGNALEPRPFEMLMEEVKAEAIFSQVSTDDRCPKLIKVIESNYLPNGAKLGDRSLSLSAIEGAFVHEGNFFFYRPGLVLGKPIVLKRQLSFPAGVAYTKSTQIEANGVLTSEYEAYILSAVMIGRSHFKVQFDSNTRAITYKFSGNGVRDVSCTFKK
jgi:hypothetical protein